MRIGRTCRRLLSVIMLIAVLFTRDIIINGIETVYAGTYDEDGGGISDGDITPESNETGNLQDNPGMNEDGTIYTVDLTNIELPGMGITAQVENKEDGSVAITWTKDASDYTTVGFVFEGVNLTGWKCVVDAEGDCCLFGLEDADRKKNDLNRNLRAITFYHMNYPAKINLGTDELLDEHDEGGNPVDYKNIGKVVFGKVLENVEKSLIVHSIKFYKNAYDAPLLVVDTDETSQNGSGNSVPGMNEDGTIYTVDLTKATYPISANIAYIQYGIDGSAYITWPEYAPNYTSVTFSFRSMDVAGWTCVVDAEGEYNIFQIADAYKRTQPWDDPLNAILHYTQHYPAIIKLDDWELEGRADEYGDLADFHKIGKVIVRKGEQNEELRMVIHSIKFYKNSEDVPKIVMTKNESPRETPTPNPTKKPSPTSTPTKKPAQQATDEPTKSLEPSPTVIPTVKPSVKPSAKPSESPMKDIGDEPEEDIRKQIDAYRSSFLVKGFRISSKDNRSILITWKRNTGAASYRIYRSVKKNGAYRLIKTVGGRKTSYTDKKAGYPKKYYYKIAAAGTYKGSNIQGPDSNICSIFLSGIITPSISVKKGSIGRIKYVTVNLKKYEGDYIDIYTALDRKKFKKLKLVSRSIARYKGKFKIQYIVKNKIIRIKVKTFKRIGKKNRYSMYSNTVSIKV